MYEDRAWRLYKKSGGLWSATGPTRKAAAARATVLSLADVRTREELLRAEARAKAGGDPAEFEAACSAAETCVGCGTATAPGLYHYCVASVVGDYAQYGSAVGRREAEALFDRFMHAYPELARWIRETRAAATTQAAVVAGDAMTFLPSGRAMHVRGQANAAGQRRAYRAFRSTGKRR